jgi:isoleucyl-tRNA synthetase
MMKLIHLAAPVIPFTTEEIYQNLKTPSMPQSIHLGDFPVTQEGQRDLQLERMMSLTQQAITMGRSLRSAHNLKIRQPLKKLYLVTRDESERKILEEMQGIISEELNVKEIYIQEDETGLVSYQAKANFKVLGQQLGKQMKQVAALIQNFSNSEIAAILDGGTKEVEYSEGKIVVSEADIVVQRFEMENMKVLNEGQLTVGFDTEITHELLLEGLARDIVRSVQSLRKESNFDVADRIVLQVHGGNEIRETFDLFGEYIKRETLAVEIQFTDSPTATEISCGEYPARISVQQVLD